jgi:hypothetical protein
MIAHRQTCLHAYVHKAAMVKDGKGRNTLAGIPAELCPQLP